MKDPTTPSPADRKKIMFYDSLDRQTKLRIRCQYDGITQSQFFRMMITGYIEKDELIFTFLHKCKEKYLIHGKQKRKTFNDLYEREKKINKQFVLGDEEIEDIFDIIASEED